MKKILAALILVATSCSSATVIRTSPEAANVFVNGQLIGMSPARYSDSKMIGSINSVTIKKEGYRELSASFSRNEEAAILPIIGGCLLFPLSVPWLWAMDYAPDRQYMLEPIQANQPPAVATLAPVAVIPQPPQQVISVDAQVGTWAGQPQNALLSAWGIPEKQLEGASNTSFYAYDLRSTNGVCTVTFVIGADKTIRSASTKGMCDGATVPKGR